MNGQNYSTHDVVLLLDGKPLPAPGASTFVHDDLFRTVGLLRRMAWLAHGDAGDLIDRHTVRFAIEDAFDLDGDSRVSAVDCLHALADRLEAARRA